MANPYFAASGSPVTNSSGASALIRAEFASIVAGFDKLPTLTSVANQVALVNTGSTALTTTPVITVSGTTTTLTGLLAGVSGTFSTTLGVTGVLTASGGVVGNVTGNASGSSGSCTGNAATATTASTATTATTATNLAAGANGTIPYQTGSGATAMLATSTNGYILQCNGVGAPTWVSPAGVGGAAPAGTLTGTTLAANVVSSSLTSVGTLASLSVTGTVTAATFSGALTGNASGSSGSCTGNAATASAVAAANLTGATLAAGVTGSSLTSVGTLGSLSVTGTVTAATFSGALTGNASGSSGSCTGNAATASAVAAANLTGATLAAVVTGSSLTSVGTLGSLTVSGAVTLNGTVALGDAVADTVSVGGTTVKNGSGNWTIPAPSSGVTWTVSGVSGTHSMKLADSATNSFNAGFLEVPANAQSAAYTCVLSDAGKSIDHPATDANARTFTINSNANVAYPVGTCITFTNMTANVVTIAITTDTMYLAGTGATGSRSLAQYGMCTARKLLSTTWLIAGTGLT